MPEVYASSHQRGKLSCWELKLQLFNIKCCCTVWRQETRFLKLKIFLKVGKKKHTCHSTSSIHRPLIYVWESLIDLIFCYSIHIQAEELLLFSAFIPYIYSIFFWQLFKSYKHNWIVKRSSVRTRSIHTVYLCSYISSTHRMLCFFFNLYF